MASGTIVLTRKGDQTGYLDGRIEWSSVSNGSAANTSTVTAHLLIHRNSTTSTTTGTFTGNFTVAGHTENVEWFNTLGYDYVVIKTITLTVAHDASGAASCYLYAYVHGPSSTSMKNTYVEGGQTVALDTIPREAKITSAPDFTDMDNPTIGYSNPAGNAVDALYACITITGEKDDIPYRAIPKTGSSYTFPLTEAERNVLRANTHGLTRTVFFLVRTTIGGIDHWHSWEVTLTIADNDVNRPSVSMDLSVVGSLPDRFAGLNIQGKTGIKMDVHSQPKLGASIQYHRYRVGGVWCDQTCYLNTSGTVKVEGFAVDSREHVGSTAKDIYVFPYSKPKISMSACERCDADGNPDDSGTYLRIKASRSFATIVQDNEHLNYCKVQYRYKAAGAGAYSEWKEILPPSELTEEQVETAALLEGALNVDTSYEVQIRAIDDIGDSAVATITIPTEDVYMHRTRDAVGLGKYTTARKAVDSDWDLLMNGHRIFDVPYPESEGEPVPLGFLNNCDLYPKKLNTIEEIDAFYNSQGKFLVGYGVIDTGAGYCGYLCFQIQWIALQFKITSSNILHRRIKYGDNGWTDWAET